MNKSLADLFAKDPTPDRIYDALVKTRTVSKHALLTYRFQRCRCAVLHVIQTPNGVLLGFPRNKLSQRVNLETSNEAGRANNTEDGKRRWKRHAGYFVSDLNVELRCDHSRKTLNTNDIAAEIEAGQGNRTVFLS